MADVLNRIDKRLLRSVNTSEFPTAEWIINPDLSGVAGQPEKYWIITGDAVSLMDQATRDAVDATEAANALANDRAANKARLDQERVLRAFALLLLDELNLHAARITAILDAIDGASNLAGVKTAVAAIADVPQRTAGQIVDAIKAKVDTI